jgi:hypothetical protein
MNAQRGMTLIGMLLTMAIVVFGGLVVMQTVPVYLQYYSIKQSIKALSSVPASALSGDSFMDAQFLRGSLNKRLDISGINSIKEEQIKVIPLSLNRFKVSLKYQVINPLMYHANLLFDFDETYEVKVGSEN